MFLDDSEQRSQIDAANLIDHINGLPGQLLDAWAHSTTLDLPAWTGLTRVLLAGMGGSALGAELLAAYAAPLCPVPILVHSSYGLPAWAAGPETLVIISSHSGRTEETLSAFAAAVENGCRVLAVTTGGELAARAGDQAVPVWQFEHTGQSGMAIGYAFVLPLAALARLGLLPGPGGELMEAVQVMQAEQTQLIPETPTAENPAKRYAGQLMGRRPVIFGAEFLTPVARRWKVQVNELAKAMAGFEPLPEADHNTLAGTQQPEEAFAHSLALFLNASGYHPRNTLRMDLTRRNFMLEGIPTDFYLAQGGSRMAQIWTTLHFGDYMAYYLAIAYGTDPTPVPAVDQFKMEMEMFG